MQIHVNITPEEYLVVGAAKISLIIKRDKRDIPSLVESGGLKAKRNGDNGKWKARCVDLFEFIDKQME